MVSLSERLYLNIFISTLLVFYLFIHSFIHSFTVAVEYFCNLEYYTVIKCYEQVCATTLNVYI